MMLHVNLIADRRLQALRAQRSLRLVSMGLLSLAVLLLVSYSLVATRLSRVQDDSVALGQAVRALAPEVEAVKSLQREKQQLAPRVELHRLSALNNQAWGQVLSLLSERRPSGLWLTEAEAPDRKTGETVILTLRGSSTSGTLVGQYLDRLNESPWFAGALELRFTRTRPSGATSVVDFEITGPLQLFRPLGRAGR